MLKGEFDFHNKSMDSEIFGSTFGLSGENWWEYYWKICLIFIRADNLEIGNDTSNVYFLQ